MARRTKELGPAIGRRVREAREQADLTVRRLAVLIHSSPNTIVLIERGDGGNSGIGLYVDLAHALHVRPCWLLFEDGPQHPKTKLELARDMLRGLSAADRKKLLADLSDLS